MWPRQSFQFADQRDIIEHHGTIERMGLSEASSAWLSCRRMRACGVSLLTPRPPSRCVCRAGVRHHALLRQPQPVPALQPRVAHTRQVPAGYLLLQVSVHLRREHHSAADKFRHRTCTAVTARLYGRSWSARGTLPSLAPAPRRLASCPPNLLAVATPPGAPYCPPCAHRHSLCYAATLSFRASLRSHPPCPRPHTDSVRHPAPTHLPRCRPPPYP